MVTTSEFQKMILDNKSKLIKVDFRVKVSDEGNYQFIIKKILKTSLDVIIFIRYENMMKNILFEKEGLIIPGNPLERQLKEIISPNAETEFDLKIDTKIKKPELFKKLITVKIEDVDYKFKISGAGEYAIKLSLKIPFKDINLKDNAKLNPLENKLKNIVYYISTDRKYTWDMDTLQIIQLLN